jgi:hypothetical protein
MIYIIKILIWWIILSFILWYSIYAWIIDNLTTSIASFNNNFILYLPVPLILFISLIFLWLIIGLIYNLKD